MSAPDPGNPPPKLTVIMANYNGERFLRRSIASVLAQTCTDLELIVSDDGSTDGSAEIAREAAKTDTRVRFLGDGAKGGPARARNRALDAATGEWIAIVDSDDLLHPERFERLLALASRYEADAVADNLLYFDDAAVAPTTFLFDARQFSRTLRLTPELVVRADTKGSGLPNFGYLKPVIRRSRLAELRYDERLKIGEDYDFMLRFLLTGATFLVTPEPTYLYRRHSASISHRLSAIAMQDMIECQSRFQPLVPDSDAKLKTALEARMASLHRGLAYEKLVAAVKGRRPGEAARLIMRDTRLIPLLFRSMNERLSRQRRTQRKQAQEPASRPVKTVLITDGGPNSTFHESDVERSGAHSEWDVERIPPYVAADDTSGNRAAMLDAVRKLVGICQRNRATLICDGRAARFAEGFVPFDHRVEDAAAMFPIPQSPPANVVPLAASIH